jgi:NOL1/NOP2/fmu family ribosome biogenesis protein
MDRNGQPIQIATGVALDPEGPVHRINFPHDMAEHLVSGRTFRLIQQAPREWVLVPVGVAARSDQDSPARLVGMADE